MAELQFIVMAGGLLRPENEETAEQVQKWKVGSFIIGKFRRPRNPKFHRKFFALLGVLFDEWEPVDSEYKGVAAEKSRERFREEITILAGYYDIVCSLKGETRVVAKSVSFASMEEPEFERLYMAVHKVGMEKILNSKGWSERDLHDAVARLMDFV